MTWTALRQVLVPRIESEKINAPEAERFVTVRLRGGGAVRRSIGEGKTPRPFVGSRIRGGDLIYSRIDARNGAFAIVGEDLAGAVVSKDFPTFGLRADQINPSYLRQLVCSPAFWARFQSLSFGATNRQRIDQGLLLAERVYIPDLTEQHRIAAILDAAEDQRAKARARVQRALSLEARSVASVFASARAGQRLADVLAGVDGGNSPVCLNRTAEAHEWAVLKLGAVTTGRFLPAENKAVTPDYTPRPALEVKPGDLLMSRKNTLEHVGASVFVESTPPQRLLPDLIFRLVPNDTRVTRTLQAYLALPGTRRDLSRLAAGSASSMANISRQRLLTLPVPDFTPGLVQKVDQIAGEIGPVLELLATAVDYSDELFASLQHRAFRGEL